MSLYTAFMILAKGGKVILSPVCATWTLRGFFPLHGRDQHGSECQALSFLFFSMCRRNNMFRQGGGLKGGECEEDVGKKGEHFFFPRLGKRLLGRGKGEWVGMCVAVRMLLPPSLFPFFSLSGTAAEKRERNINGGRVGLLLLLKAPPPLS